MLEMQQVKGERVSAQACVLANYIKQELPEVKTAVVSVRQVSVYPLNAHLTPVNRRQDEVLDMNVYYNVRDFVADFDDGKYPYLVAE